jgi:hypothetical protein
MNISFMLLADFLEVWIQKSKLSLYFSQFFYIVLYLLSAFQNLVCWPKDGIQIEGISELDAENI